MVISEWSESQDIVTDLKALCDRCLKETGREAVACLLPKIHFNTLLELGFIHSDGTVTDKGVAAHGLPVTLTINKY